MLEDFFNDIEREFHHIGSDDILMFFGIMFGIMFVSIIIILITNAKRKKEDAAQPIRKEMAHVVEKESIDPGYLEFEINILFETEKGERLKLLAKTQNLLAVGDFGLLTWQGRKVINFERKIDPKK